MYIGGVGKEIKWFLNFLIGNLRAYGGCLDSKKVMKDAAWRRYASGRCPAIFDPRMSEWGNPSRFIGISWHFSQETHPVK